MQTLSFTIQADTSFNAQHLSDFLKSLPHIKSVTTEKKPNPKTLTSADWVRPGRPATDEEIENMLDKSEKGKFLTAEEAKLNTFKKIEKWKRKKLK